MTAGMANDMGYSVSRWLAASTAASGVAFGSMGLVQSAYGNPSNEELGTVAREAMIAIFDKKDPSAIDRFFAAPFIQHDPNVADGLAGLKQYAEEIADSPAPRIKIHRTLV